MPSNEAISTYRSQVKATLKFVWRYLLSVVVVLFAVYVFINERFINIENFVTLFSSAFIIDWVKMKFKMIPNPDYKHGSGFDDRPLNTQQWWNSAMLGTPAYFIDQAGKK